MASLADIAARASAGDAIADRELTLLAAGGDLEAQRELLTILLGDPDEIHTRTFAEVAHAELLARFCALRGHVLDGRRLAAILWQMARAAPDEAGRSHFAMQAAVLLRDLADDGDGVASERLSSLAGDFPDTWAAVENGEPCIAPPPSNITPPPIVRANCAAPTLGDILAEAFSQVGPPASRGLLDKARDYFTDLAWRIRFRLSQSQ